MIVIILIVVVVLLVVLGGFVVVGLNKLRGQSVRVDEAESGIDVQLTRRAELIPNLVETVKGYTDHESSTLEAVTAARTAASTASTVEEKAAADAQTTRALANVFAVAESYPELKASQNFQQLQGELTRTEDNLAFARQYYNDSVATLNKTMVTIPWSLVVGMSGVHEARFYDAPTGNAAPPQVDFGT